MNFFQKVKLKSPKPNTVLIIITVLILVTAVFAYIPTDQPNLLQRFVNFFKKPNKFSVVSGCQVPLNLKEILLTNYTSKRYIAVENVVKRNKFLPWTLVPQQKEIVHKLVLPYLSDLTKRTNHNFRLVGYNNVIVSVDNSKNAQYRLDMFVHDFTGGQGNTEYRFLFDLVMFNDGKKHLNFIRILNSQDMKSNMFKQEDVSYTSIQEGNTTNPDPKDLEFSVLKNKYESSLSRKIV